MGAEDEIWRAVDVGAADFDARWAEWIAAGNGRGAIERLRARYGPELARFVSLQVELSTRASARFPDRRLNFFTAKGLEQATSPRVADERVHQMTEALGASNSALGDAFVWDACCGLGSDTVAFLAARIPVVATDFNGATLRCATSNGMLAVRRSKGGGDVAFLSVLADMQRAPLQGHEMRRRGFALFDPDRRDPSGARLPSPNRWSPPLTRILEEADQCAGACIKLPPGLELDRIDPGVLETCRLTWVSYGGEMKELMLWTGALAEGPKRQAIRLSDAETRTVQLGGLAAAQTAGIRTERSWDGQRGQLAGMWLVELDVALWQSGLYADVAEEFGLERIDPSNRGGFFVSASPPTTEWARSWRILEVTNADRKRVRAMLRSKATGRLTVKTRGVRESAEALETKFRLDATGRGGAPALLAITPATSDTTRASASSTLAILLDPT